MHLPSAPLTGLLCLFLASSISAQPGQPAVADPGADAAEPRTRLVAGTVDTLSSFVDLRNAMLKDIKDVNEKIGASHSDAEKENLKLQVNKLESDLHAVTQNFENISAGTDITILRETASEEFNFQKELFALLKPALDEIKEMTSHVRQKSDLKDKIANYEESLPVIEQAIANVERLLSISDDKAVTQALKVTLDKWQRQKTFMQNEAQAAQLQLQELISTEVSLTQASQSYLKTFFQQRGLFLTIALAVVIGFLLLSHWTHLAMLRFVPGFKKLHRSFRIRLTELIHRIVTFFLVIIGPMVVFYVAEDWVLFSLSILLLLGAAWTLRQALPRYLHQIQMFLNIGSVREGERIQLDGLPWQVRQINVFCTLVNPVAELTQRVPIADLVDLKSRPAKRDEPWFPCRKGDWVLLGDGIRGKVAGISPELVQLVEEGGTRTTYQASDFLAKTPRNLTTNFRIRETLGISYELQKDSTTSIPETLQGYIQQRAQQEGYGEGMLNLRVEFELASNSSLDIAVIADFDGELADVYNRLRRSIQRWCVDACTEYAWEIPFPQMTLHGNLGRTD